MNTTPDIAIVRTVADLRQVVRGWRRDDLSVGLVPTMGALHAGHLALVETAKAQNDRVVTSIFVNPAQFGPSEDLSRYPRREAEDTAELAKLGVELVWAPPVEEVYPDGFCTRVEVGGLSERLEGAHRQGHFAGVTTVVAKLLLQALPDRVYFGQKDYQQLQVVRRMVRDLDIPTEVVGVETVREADGLALSSRNEYLSAAEREIAPALNRVLRETAETVRAGEDPSRAVKSAEATLLEAGFASVDYVAVADAETLEPVGTLTDRPARVLAAAFLGKTRLIDNCPVVPDA